MIFLEKSCLENKSILAWGNNWKTVDDCQSMFHDNRLFLFRTKWNWNFKNILVKDRYFFIFSKKQNLGRFFLPSVESALVILRFTTENYVVFCHYLGWYLYNADLSAISGHGIWWYTDLNDLYHYMSNWCIIVKTWSESVF